MGQKEATSFPKQLHWCGQVPDLMLCQLENQKEGEGYNVPPSIPLETALQTLE